MVYTENFCRGRLSSFTPKNGDEFIGCNLSQIIPHTKVFEGITELVFTRCNVMNCDFPADATLINCYLIMHKDLCSHNYPKRVEREQMVACPVDCKHVDGEPDIITIDGVLVDTFYYYKDLEVS